MAKTCSQAEEAAPRCARCGSEHIVKNGKIVCGNQPFRCEPAVPAGDCGIQEPLGEPPHATRKPCVPWLVSGRACGRWRGSWLWGATRYRLAKKAEALPPLSETLLPAQAGDVLELDELRSFVGSKANQRWVWIALCRQTRQVVASFVGDRSVKSARVLRERIPPNYRCWATRSDFWLTHAEVFPAAPTACATRAKGRPATSNAGTAPCDSV